MGTLYLFCYSQITHLKETPPLRVIRRDLAPMTPGFQTVYYSLSILLALFLFYQLGDWALAIRILLISIFVFIVLALLSYFLLKLIVLLNRKSSLAWRYGITNISRRAQANSVQMVGFGLGLMALLILSIVRVDLMDQWQASLPADAPNQFVINIQDKQVKSVKQFFTQHGFNDLKFYPMVRGRLIKINDRAVSANDYPSARAKRLINREFNISWAQKPQTKNRVIAGLWWNTETNPAQMSIESGIAKTLGIKLHDKLTYVIAGESISAKITSIRKVNWDTLRPNFFVLAYPGLLNHFPKTWISSFHLPASQGDFLTNLVKHYPNLTVLDVAAILGQMRNIMNKAISGIEFIFVFTLIAGFVVLLAAIEASQDIRLKEGGLIRALGGQRRLLLKSYFIEFGVIGLIAGLMAAIGATLAAYFISYSILNIEFTLNLNWWLVGALVGSLGVGSLGLLGSLHLIRKPPIESLRKFQ